MNLSVAKKGDRIRLLSTSDPHVTIPPGSEGTVVLVDGLGTTHVKFDDGTELGLVADEDAFELVRPGLPDSGHASA